MKWGCNLFLTFAALLGCQRNQPSETTITKVRDLRDINFAIIAFKNGEASAYNPEVHASLLPVRYSDSVGMNIQTALNAMKPSCKLIGFEASVEGESVRVGEEQTWMLNIEQISDLRPLSELKLRQLNERSPTLSRTEMCSYG